MEFELKKASKIYNRFTSSEVIALREANLKISGNDFISVMGVSGSGKSTMLHILGCLDEPTEGGYYINGENVINLDKNKLRNETIGFILQNFGLLFNKSVYENVAYPLLLGTKVKYCDIKAKVDSALKQVGMLTFRDRLASDLSGGQRQRVAIARAIVNDPDLILADEPTAALDSNTAKEITELFAELNRNGTAVVIVTHDNSVAEICRRKFRITDGTICEVT